MIEKENITQENVREKLVRKTLAMKRSSISEQTGIPEEMISRFKSGKRDLWEESLTKLNQYLDNY